MLIRIVIILCSLVLSAAYFLPSLPVVRESSLQKILPDAKVNLGLDLKGGIYLTLGVDVDKAVENYLAQVSQDIRFSMGRDISVPVRPRVIGGAMLEFDIAGEHQAAVVKLLRDNFNQFDFTPETLPDGSIRYSGSFTPEERKNLESTALDMALKTIRNRIDQFGVLEPDIRKQEQEKRIVVQLPGFDDTQRAIQIISQTAHLEFHIEYQGTAQEMARAERGILPPNVISMPMANGNGSMLLYRDVALTGEYVENAHQDYDEHRRPAVALSFNRAGASKFERVTGENVNNRMAIVLDGKIHSAPEIRTKISGGRASITGNFSLAEANDLALVLKSGSLPAPVTVLEERTVGPSLGKESIEKGIHAAIIGWGLTIVFIIIYYSFSGVIAASMLAVDLLMLLAGMAALGATLTLPGIAGIVLTIGMAVDANVLIFERIREELKRGLTPVKAMEIGFSRATIAITDSNLTTIIAAVILYQFGTGPVRGFAVTLSLGIIISMFTAIFVSRTIFELWINKNTKKISI